MTAIASSAMSGDLSPAVAGAEARSAAGDGGDIRSFLHACRDPVA